MFHRLLPTLGVAAAASTLLLAGCGAGGSAAFGGSQAPAVPVVSPAAAAGSGSAGSGSGSGSALPATGDGGLAGLQPNARNMKVAILAPRDQTKVDAPAVDVQVVSTGFTQRCDLLGKGAQEGEGHQDVYLDATLIDFSCAPTFHLSMQNVDPGKHTITVIPAQNDNREVRQNAVAVSFQYEPTSPIAHIPAARFGSAPTIRILSPAPDSAVSGVIDVVVGVTGLNLDGSLMGKDDVPGYGHWYVSLDGMSQPDSSGIPGNVMGFSSARTFRLSTAGLVKGSVHTLYAVLANDDHTPVSPSATDQIQLRID
jgi:hypothetical protein